MHIDQKWVFKIIIHQVFFQALTLQGFWYFARSRSHEFQVNPWNPAKFTKTREIPRNLTKCMSAQHIWKSYLGFWGCFLAVKSLIYLEISSAQRINNIPKLPGVLRLMLWKAGKQRCKNPGVPSVDLGNWGWECDSLFYRVLGSSWRMLRFVKDYALYVHLTYKDDDLFRNGLIYEW